MLHYADDEGVQLHSTVHLYHQQHTSSIPFNTAAVLTGDNASTLPRRQLLNASEAAQELPPELAPAPAGSEQADSLPIPEQVLTLDLAGGIQLLAFCVFEVLIGMFWPSMMTLRAKYVSEEQRSTIISLFRIPLNLFVCIILWKVSAPVWPAWQAGCCLCSAVASS